MPDPYPLCVVQHPPQLNLHTCERNLATPPTPSPYYLFLPFLPNSLRYLFLIASVVVPFLPNSLRYLFLIASVVVSV